MDIQQLSPEHLVLRYRPIHIWIQSSILFGAAFFITPNTPSVAVKALFAIALAAFSVYQVWAFGDIVTTYLDRSRGLVRVRCSGLRGDRTTACALEQITQVVIEERVRRRRGLRRIYVYWVLLQTAASHPIQITSCPFSDGTKAASVASTVCQFLDLPPYTIIEYRPIHWLL